MKEALSLRKQNKQTAALPKKGKGQHHVPGDHLPSKGGHSKSPTPKNSKTLFQVGIYSNDNPGQADCITLDCKKKPEQHKIDGVGFKSIKINETLSQHSQRTGQLENMPKLKAKQQHF